VDATRMTAIKSANRAAHETWAIYLIW
jgi:hypothetical protein